MQPFGFYTGLSHIQFKSEFLPILVLFQGMKDSVGNKSMVAETPQLIEVNIVFKMYDLLFILLSYSGELVAQFKFTVLLMPNGPQRWVTGSNFHTPLSVKHCLIFTLHLRRKGLVTSNFF